MGLTFENVDVAEIGKATLDTLTMLGFSTLFTVLIGLPLGVLLFLTSKGQLLENRVFYTIASFVVNVLRSVPFIILMIMLIPLTKILVGTSLGVKGAIPPLVIGAAPFFARLVETSLREVDRGVIEAAQSMGASKWQIIWNVLLPESRPGLIAGITITTVALVSYTAMSGVIGGGGLGDLAIKYGYIRYMYDVMMAAIVVLVVVVQIIQLAGDKSASRSDKR